MIVGALLDLLGAVLSAMLSVLPSVPVPSWLTDANGLFADVVGYGASMGAWVPWSVGGGVVGTLLAMVAVSATVKLTRLVISLFTGGGGSAA